MKSSRSFIFLTASLIAYAALCITLFTHERLTGDATLYISIAEKYLSGDFGNAVNGYWGPLLAWILVPLLYSGFSHLVAINAVNVLFGLLTLFGVWKLSYRFDMAENIRCVLFLPLVPIMLFFSLIEPMDLLLLCVLVYYLFVVFNEGYSARLSHGVMAGLLGASAYFAKPYGFPFFISHFFLINVCHYFNNTSPEKKKNVLNNFLIGFVIFSLISGVWIALISTKYDRITFSMMGSGVLQSLGPGSEHETLEKGDPIFYEGFFPPPNETAHVIYEDPSYARKKTWSPLESWDFFEHLLINVKKNILKSIQIYESFSRLSIALVIVYILLSVSRPWKKLLESSDILYPLLTLLLYSSGYMLFHFEARYLWIVNILLLLMGGKVVNVLFQNELFSSKAGRNLLIGFFILSFMVTPMKSIIEISGSNINKEMHELGQVLKHYGIHGNIASNRIRKEVEIHDSWHKTFRLSYWLQSRYFGQARKDITDLELETELENNDIDFYFFWGEHNETVQFLSDYKEITHEEIPGLRVYSLKEKK